MLGDRFDALQSSELAGFTAAHWTAAKGEKKFFEKVRLRGVGLDSPESAGWTPLNWAVVMGHEKPVNQLISQDVELNPLDNDKYSGTPLHQVVAHNRMNIVRLLIDAGVDLDARAIRLAEAILIKFAEFEPDLSILDERGRTSVEFARSNGDPELAKMMSDILADE